MNNMIFLTINMLFSIIMLFLVIITFRQMRKAKKSEAILSETLHNIDEEIGIKNKKEKAVRDAFAYGVTAYYILGWETEKLENLR